jgi:hypothetical protein
VPANAASSLAIIGATFGLSLKQGTTTLSSSEPSGLGDLNSSAAVVMSGMVL